MRQNESTVSAKHVQPNRWPAGSQSHSASIALSWPGARLCKASEAKFEESKSGMWANNGSSMLA
ncbi:hypothetical protein N7471_004707 [Penicillium samsonianum]|uniref:uncharacterized protein n=1 Tax=Penicillium samsonianum TaxID=1882272 RepID=UPI002547C684|nr:uncharacterized protein N7471_004707 [Penicillium samsonianum]KAJ6138221.1 hypothetical protein N7471_004707 [Penicillium samsonianum]